MLKQLPQGGWLLFGRMRRRKTKKYERKSYMDTMNAHTQTHLIFAHIQHHKIVFRASFCWPFSNIVIFFFFLFSDVVFGYYVLIHSNMFPTLQYSKFWLSIGFNSIFGFGSCIITINHRFINQFSSSIFHKMHFQANLCHRQNI